MRRLPQDFGALKGFSFGKFFCHLFKTIEDPGFGKTFDLYQGCEALLVRSRQRPAR